MQSGQWTCTLPIPVNRLSSIFDNYQGLYLPWIVDLVAYTTICCTLVLERQIQQYFMSGSLHFFMLTENPIASTKPNLLV